MQVVTLNATNVEGYLIGSDGATYTPADRVEARCRWCRRWGHAVGLYRRLAAPTGKPVLVCGRHVRVRTR